MFVHVIGTKFALLLLQATQLNPGELTSDQKTQIALEALKHPYNVPGGALSSLVPIALFAMVVLLAWLGLRRKQALMRERAEVQKRLLDKFTSGPELTAFLESAGGQRFLEEISSPGVGPARSLPGLRIGIIMAVLGLGMLGLSISKRGHFETAVIFLCLGTGFLISTAISYRLSKQSEKNQKLDRQGAPSS